jgi:hypothetical protein
VQAGRHDLEAADLRVAAQQRAAAEALVHHRLGVFLLAGCLQRAAAEVAGACNPTAQNDGGTDVVGAKFAAGMGAVHGRGFVEANLPHREPV